MRWQTSRRARDGRVDRGIEISCDNTVVQHYTRTAVVLRNPVARGRRTHSHIGNLHGSGCRSHSTAHPTTYFLLLVLDSRKTSFLYTVQHATLRLATSARLSYGSRSRTASAAETCHNTGAALVLRCSGTPGLQHMCEGAPRCRIGHTIGPCGAPTSAHNLSPVRLAATVRPLPSASTTKPQLPPPPLPLPLPPRTPKHCLV